MERQELIKKIEELSPELLAEVGEFVDSIARPDQDLDRTSRHRAITDYAEQYAGSAADLDADLEATAVEHLLQQTSQQ